LIKNYILDTNVLLHDPHSLLSFQDNSVLVPIEVIEEIDRFKRESSDRGQNARAVSRLLDALRGQGRLSEGVPLPTGGRLRILLHGKNGTPSVTLNGTTVDDRLIALTRDIQEADPGAPTILVTKDINLRIKADAVGLQAEDYETDHVHIQDLYTGAFEMQVGSEAIAAFRAQGELVLNGNGPRCPNEYCTLTDETNLKRTALARVDISGQRLLPILDYREGAWGIRPRNREQHFAFDALLDERVRLVTLMGKAGTGKTLVALAAGLKKTIQDRDYRRMIEALSYIRGRNIANQFIVVDEAQNLTPLEVKTIITRVGHGTKIILTGDPYQIDNPYVDSSSNGFNYVVSKFRAQPIAAHIELMKGERSELAEVAANIL
jgi:PhoH-like ATPase